MEENRKLVFKEKVEERRVKRFKTISIFITLIVCTFVIPLFELWNYNQIKIKAIEYINITEDIWYEGIEEIKYNELNISILDDNIKYEDIYNEGINSIGYNKIRLRMYIDNKYWITQKGNTITIKDDLNRKIATLKFEENDIEIINKSKISIITWTICLIILFIYLSTIITAFYINNEEARMIRDMNKLRSDNYTQ